MATSTSAIIVKAKRLPHMPQLDSLRAFAVAAVVFHHLIPGGWGYGAAAGVRLFFTLSGFLITGILLRANDDVDAGLQTRWQALGRFYARRFLRIFPLYYFVVSVALILNLQPTRQIVAWLLTYTLNIRMAHQGWYEAHVAHFWSLCVEEQFYLLWPGLLLFCKRRWLKLLIPAVIAAGPLYRASYVLSGYTNMRSLSIYISTVTSLDSLGIGALAALLWSARGEIRSRKALISMAAVSASATVYLALKHGSPLGIIFHDTAQSAAFGCLIAGAAWGFPGSIGGLLEWGPILYIGKISYGIYVYHPFARELVTALTNRVGTTLPYDTWSLFALGVLMTLVLASLSWKLLEKPMNDLKRFF